MKVISTIPHESVVKRVVCHSCGATLEYTPSDVRLQKHTDYTGCTDVTKVVICPCCSAELLAK